MHTLKFFAQLVLRQMSKAAISTPGHHSFFHNTPSPPLHSLSCPSVPSYPLCPLLTSCIMVPPLPSPFLLSLPFFLLFLLFSLPPSLSFCPLFSLVWLNATKNAFSFPCSSLFISTLSPPLPLSSSVTLFLPFFPSFFWLKEIKECKVFA